MGSDLAVNKVLWDYKREKQCMKVYKHIKKYAYINERLSDSKPIDGAIVVNQTIWICWLQGLKSAPRIVRKCVESIERFKPDAWNVVLITYDNIDQFINFPTFIQAKFKEGKFSSTHFSDIIRLELLNRYGGCWIDATVFCSAEIPHYMFSDELFMFQRRSLMNASILEISSWWIAAHKGNAIIYQVLECLYQYWKRENRLRHYFLLHIIFTRIIYKNSENMKQFSEMKYKNTNESHILQSLLWHPYDDEKYNFVKMNCFVHKLTYKEYCLRGNTYMFFDALINDN